MEDKHVIGFLCFLCLAIIFFWILYLYKIYSSPIYGQIDATSENAPSEQRAFSLSIPIADISNAGSTFDGASE